MSWELTIRDVVWEISTGAKLFIGSKVQCGFYFEICTQEKGEKGGNEK